MVLFQPPNGGVLPPNQMEGPAPRTKHIVIPAGPPSTPNKALLDAATEYVPEFCRGSQEFIKRKLVIFERLKYSFTNSLPLSYFASSAQDFRAFIEQV